MENIKLIFENARKYHYFFEIIVKKDIIRKYRGSFLGIIWSLLNPLLTMLVLTVVFSTLFKRDINNFPLYLISGKLIYDFFSIATNAAMRSITSSASLIRKVYVPKYLLTVSKVSSNFIILCITLIDLIIVMLITNARITFLVIYLPIVLLFLFIYTVGFGLIIATLGTFFRDVEHLYSVFLMILMYICAIFYPVNIVPIQFRIIFTLNPVYQYIEAFRALVYYNVIPDFTNVLLCILYALTSIVTGIFVFKKNQDKFIFYV